MYPSHRKSQRILRSATEWQGIIVWVHFARTFVTASGLLEPEEEGIGNWSLLSAE